MDREQIRHAVIEILQTSSRPLKAKDIRTAYCRDTGQWFVTTKDINSVLHLDLRSVAEQDSAFRWTIRKGGCPVAGYGRRYNRNPRGRSFGKERALQHIREAERLSEQLGGTDVDVKQYFFGLPEGDLKNVLDPLPELNRNRMEDWYR